MNKIFSTIVMIACLGLTYNAYAAGACTRTTTPPTGLTNRASITGCTGTVTSYFIMNSYGSMTDMLGSCSACDSCYSRQAVTASNVRTTGSAGAVFGGACSNPDSMVSGLYTCVAKTCSNCTSDTSWSSAGTGYMKKVTRTCDCGVCKESTAYQCASGYWGSSTNGTSGCTQCPTWSGVYTNSARTALARGTCSSGVTAITGCYVIPGTYYDATGTFTISNAPCMYSN